MKNNLTHDLTLLERHIWGSKITLKALLLIVQVHHV